MYILEFYPISEDVFESLTSKNTTFFQVIIVVDPGEIIVVRRWNSLRINSRQSICDSIISISVIRGHGTRKLNPRKNCEPKVIYFCFSMRLMLNHLVHHKIFLESTRVTKDSVVRIISIGFWKNVLLVYRIEENKYLAKDVEKNEFLPK